MFLITNAPSGRPRTSLPSLRRGGNCWVSLVIIEYLNSTEHECRKDVWLDIRGKGYIEAHLRLVRTNRLGQECEASEDSGG